MLSRESRLRVEVEYTPVKLLDDLAVQLTGGFRYLEMSGGTFRTLLKLLEYIRVCESEDSYYSRSPLIEEHRQVFLNNKNSELSKHVICGEIHKYLTRYMSPKEGNCEKAGNEKDLLKIIHFCLIELERIELNRNNE